MDKSITELVNTEKSQLRFLTEVITPLDLIVEAKDLLVDLALIGKKALYVQTNLPTTLILAVTSSQEEMSLMIITGLYGLSLPSMSYTNLLKSANI
jgi:hypothetical protein